MAPLHMLGPSMEEQILCQCLGSLYGFKRDRTSKQSSRPISLRHRSACVLSPFVKTNFRPGMACGERTWGCRPLLALPLATH